MVDKVLQCVGEELFLFVVVSQTYSTYMSVEYTQSCAHAYGRWQEYETEGVVQCRDIQERLLANGVPVTIEALTR